MIDRIQELFDQVMDSPEPLRRFAELVAADEREACANLSDEHDDDVGMAISRAIRARGKRNEKP